MLTSTDLSELHFQRWTDHDVDLNSLTSLIPIGNCLLSSLILPKKDDKNYYLLFFVWVYLLFFAPKQLSETLADLCNAVGSVQIQGLQAQIPAQSRNICGD